ncbi:Carbamoyl-phosphate synthase large chain [Streptomyces alboniger]
MALENRLPCVYLVDSGGAFLPMQDEVFPDREHFGRIFYNQARMSGAGIPQIAAVLGSCTAGGAYVPAMSDEAVIVRNQGTIFLGGPPLVKAATGEVVTAEELGGGEVHARVSGVTDHLAEDDAHALRIVRNIAATLPARGPLPWEVRPAVEPKVDPCRAVRRRASGGFPHPLRRTRDHRARGRRLPFRRVQGRVRADPRHRLRPDPRPSGRDRREQRHPLLQSPPRRAPTSSSCATRARIPLVFLQNISGFMVGKDYEAGGIAKHGAKMVTAVACTRVPKLTVVVGGSYGAGNYSMCGRAYSPRFLWMWPNAKISVMGGEQAASVLATVKRDQSEARGQTWPAEDEEAFKAPIRAQYERQGNAYYATARLWDDGVVDPLDTRQALGWPADRLCQRATGRPPVRRLPDVRDLPTMFRQTMFDTVLVANRGEIAVRVIRTLRSLGVRSVAVFSDADADARHVREADTAVRLGPAPAAESYLSVERLLAAAERTGAQAVHPGYGFLAENAGFARACADAGLVFIGPPAEAIALMGDKIRAKETVRAAGVPVVPGSSGSGLTDAELADAAREIGMPVLLKPSAGGGGKGMRLVRDPSVLADEIAAARREARASFGDDTLLVERWVDRPRHIEIQVLADGHGHVIRLGERGVAPSSAATRSSRRRRPSSWTRRPGRRWARRRSRRHVHAGTRARARSSSSSPAATRRRTTW